VQAAREQHQLDITPPPPPLEVRLRTFAMNADTFTEDEAAQALDVPKAKLHRLLSGYVEESRVARTRRGREWVYAWLAPDADSSARPRHATPENVTAIAEHHRGAVAGTGRSKLSGRKDVDRLARPARP
jgi:hypothetical protein